MVFVWPTTVLPRVRLMLILRQMLSAELDRLLLLTLVLEVTPSNMLSLDRRDSLSDLQPHLWVCPKRGAQAYHHLQHNHQDRGWQIISQTFVNMLSQEEYLSGCSSKYAQYHPELLRAWSGIGIRTKLVPFPGTWPCTFPCTHFSSPALLYQTSKTLFCLFRRVPWFNFQQSHRNIAK